MSYRPNAWKIKQLVWNEKKNSSNILNYIKDHILLSTLEERRTKSVDYVCLIFIVVVDPLTKKTMAPRVQYFTTRNSFHATPNLFHATQISFHATPNTFPAQLQKFHIWSVIYLRIVLITWSGSGIWAYTLHVPVKSELYTILQVNTVKC